MIKTNQKETELKYQKAKELYDKGISQLEIATLLNMRPNSLAIGMRKRFGLMPKGKRIIENFNQQQKELLFGSLLGDGYLNFKYKDNKIIGNIRFCEEHGEKQELYLKYKGKILNNHLSKTGISFRERFDTRFKNPNHILFTLRTKANLALNDFYKQFYDGRKKKVPIDLSLLTPFAIAIWYMDDGSKSDKTYILSTNSFSYEDVKHLKKYLYNKYDLECTINSKHQLRIRTNSAKKFKNLIKNYIIDSMKYKLHEY